MCFLPFSSHSPAEVAFLTIGVLLKHVVLTHIPLLVGLPRDALQRLPQAVGQSPFLDGRPGAEGQAIGPASPLPPGSPSEQGPSTGRALLSELSSQALHTPSGPMCGRVPEPAADSAQQALLGHLGLRGGVSKATFASGSELIMIQRAAEVPSRG